jgi:ribonuclease HI
LAKKYYVVWKGRTTGIFTDWNSCKNQVDKFPGAKYKSFKTRGEAEAAFKNRSASTSPSKKSVVKLKNSISRNSIGTLSNEQVLEIPVHTKIFTDGACDPNPGEAGSGIAIYRSSLISELWYGLYNPLGTNNTAELNALYQALSICKTELSTGATVSVFCDSKYSIQCVTQWASGWEKKGWKKSGGEIKNLEIIKEMHELYQSIKGEMHIFHVNGHVGIEGNELADRMSMLAIESKESEFCLYREHVYIEKILLMKTG